MSRYIDADDFFRTFEELDIEPYNNFPTADVVEVVRGEWQVYYDEDSPQDGIWKCSKCNYIRLIDDISPPNYCPNCGARMKEGDAT